MRAEALLEGLRQAMPVATAPYAPPSATGLIIVDEVNGFCTVGAGPLAPRTPNAQVERMIEVTAKVARQFRERRLPVLVFLDTHEPGKDEPPYPPHCVRGTGEEDLVPDLAWLAEDPDVTLIRKDCMNAFVGAMEPTFAKGSHGALRNRLTEWINAQRLEFDHRDGHLLGHLRARSRLDDAGRPEPRARSDAQGCGRARARDRDLRPARRGDGCSRPPAHGVPPAGAGPPYRPACAGSPGCVSCILTDGILNGPRGAAVLRSLVSWRC